MLANCVFADRDCIASGWPLNGWLFERGMQLAQSEKKTCYGRLDRYILAPHEMKMTRVKNISYSLRMIVFISYRFIYTWKHFQKCSKTPIPASGVRIKRTKWRKMRKTWQMKITWTWTEPLFGAFAAKWKCMRIVHEMWKQIKMILY